MLYHFCSYCQDLYLIQEILRGSVLSK